MNKLIKTILLSAALLFSSASFADEDYCGMKGTSANVKVDFTTCKNQPRMLFMAEINYKTVVNNPLLDGDPIQEYVKERMASDPIYRKKLETNYNITSLITLLISSLIAILIWPIAIQNAAKITLIKASPAEDDDYKYTHKLEWLVKIIASIFVIGIVGGLSIAGWCIVYLITGSVKLEDGTARTLQYIGETYRTELKEEHETLNEYDNEKVVVNFEKVQSIIIILDLYEKIYGPMAQTDKAYLALDNQPLISDTENFAHIVDNRLEFFRYMKNSAVREYSQGKMVVPAPDLNWLNTDYKELEIEKNYVTDNIDEILPNLISLREDLKKFSEKNNSNTISIDAVIDSVFLMSASKVRLKYYKEIINDNTFRKMWMARLSEACYDNYNAADSSKRYFNSFLSTPPIPNKSGDTGSPFCIHHNGMEYEVLGLGSNYDNTKAKTSDRSVQDGFYKQELQYFNEAVDDLHALFEKLAAIRISAGITQEDVQYKREAATNGLSYILNSNYLIWDSQRKAVATRSFALNSGDKVIGKGSENNYINYEYLSRGGKKAFAESNLDFSIYRERLKKEVLSTTVASKSSLESLSQTIEASKTLSEVSNNSMDFLMNPFDEFYKKVGMNPDCLLKIEKCETPSFNIQENLTEFGNNLIDKSMKFIFYSTEAIIAERFINKFTSSKDSEKGSVGAKNSKSKLAKTAVQKAGNLAGIYGGITGAVATFVLIAGIFLAKVLPFLANAPFFIAYQLFTVLMPLIAYLISLFLLWAFISNDKNNLVGFGTRLLAIMAIIVLTPSLLIFAKWLSVWMISLSLYLSALFSSLIPATGYVGMAIKLLFLIVMLIPAVTIAVRACYGIIRTFYEILGSSFFVVDQPLEVLTLLDKTISQWLPMAALARMAFGKKAHNSFEKLMRGKQLELEKAKRNAGENV